MNVELSETVQDDGDVFRVHSSIYTDPSIFDLEMERLFHGSWVYVGHEAEIPLPGDYKTGVVGRYPVIVSRDPQQNVHVLLNRCMHRGAIVCRESRGHSNHFRCTYHNWVYSNDGTLVGPAQKSGYPDDFDKERLALVSAPRVEYYRGLIFASFNAEVEPLNAVWRQCGRTSTHGATGRLLAVFRCRTRSTATSTRRLEAAAGQRRGRLPRQLRPRVVHTNPGAIGGTHPRRGAQGTQRHRDRKPREGPRSR